MKPEPKTIETCSDLVIERRPDPPLPLWPWLAVAVSLAGLGGRRLLVRRAIRMSYRIEAHQDLERLREQTTPPAWDESEKHLDLRLVARPDPGQQSLELDGEPDAGATGEETGR